MDLWVPFHAQIWVFVWLFKCSNMEGVFVVIFAHICLFSHVFGDQIEPGAPFDMKPTWSDAEFRAGSISEV